MLQGRDRGAPPAEASTPATRCDLGGDLESSLRRRAPPPPRASAGGPLAGTPPLSPRTWAGLCRAACAAPRSTAVRGLRIAARRAAERIVSEVRFLGGLRSSTPRRGRVFREPADGEHRRAPRAAGRRSRSPAQAGPGPRATGSTGERRKTATRRKPQATPPRLTCHDHTHDPGPEAHRPRGRPCAGHAGRDRHLPGGPGDVPRQQWPAPAEADAGRPGCDDLGPQQGRAGDGPLRARGRRRSAPHREDRARLGRRAAAAACLRLDGHLPRGGAAAWPHPAGHVLRGR